MKVHAMPWTRVCQRQTLIDDERLLPDDMLLKFFSLASVLKYKKYSAISRGGCIKFYKGRLRPDVQLFNLL